MAYNMTAAQQNFQDLARQYQQLLGQQQQAQQYVQPQPLQIPISVQPRQIQYVEGIAGARIYQSNMEPNSSEIIMDRDDNIFYKVSKDANGTPAKVITICRFTIEEMAEEQPTFLTRKDLEDFKEEIRQMLIPKQNVSQQKQPVKKEN